MSSLANNGGIAGGLPSLTPQTSGGSMVGNAPASATGAGGMEELLPLVIQLTKPEQVSCQ